MRDYDGKTAIERVTERRDKLIDAGFELFGQHGFAGTSIRAVLRQSGLIDRYWAENFADLDSLLAAVYDRLIDEELAACRAAIEATSGRSEAARAMIDTIAGFLEDDPYCARIHLSEVLSGGPVSRGSAARVSTNLHNSSPICCQPRATAANGSCSVLQWWPRPMSTYVPGSTTERA